MNTPLELLGRFEQIFFKYNTVVDEKEKNFQPPHSPDHTLYLHFYKKKSPKFSTRVSHDECVIESKQLVGGKVQEKTFVLNSLTPNLVRDEDGYNPTELEIKNMYYLHILFSSKNGTLGHAIFNSLYYLSLSEPLDSEELACLTKTAEILEKCHGNPLLDCVPLIEELLNFLSTQKSLKYYYESPNTNFINALMALAVVIATLTIVATVGAMIGMLGFVVAPMVGGLVAAFLGLVLVIPVMKINESIGVSSFRQFKEFLTFKEIKPFAEPHYLNLANSCVHFFKSENKIGLSSIPKFPQVLSNLSEDDDNCEHFAFNKYYGT